MKDQLIKYLQGMQCEWFPVEWDSFVYNFLGSIRKYSEEDLKKTQLCYTFYNDYYTISILSDYNGGECTPFHYFTLDRCETLLLNTVRSVDEQKRKIKKGISYFYTVWVDNGSVIIQISIPSRSENKIVWENGEFK